jgi:hypothetical protein
VAAVGAGHRIAEGQGVCRCRVDHVAIGRVDDAIRAATALKEEALAVVLDGQPQLEADGVGLAVYSLPRVHLTADRAVCRIAELGA